MEDTHKLIRRWQRGDSQAFELLFLKYEGLVFRSAVLMTGNRQQAEDVLQDVFTSVWDARGSYNPKKAKFITWLHRITVNRCIDNHRRQKLRQPCPESDAFEMVADSDDLPEEEVINKLECQRLLQAVSRLDDRHRPALVLRYFHDLPYRDIAEILDIPLGTVKPRIHNALGLLRQELSPLALDNEGRF